MLDRLKEVYKGKKIFITGHTGFKGAWLLKIFSILGAEVKGYALPPATEHDLYHLINGDQIADSQIDDLRNRPALMESVRSFAPEFIFHLGAQPLVRLSYQIPSETFEVNAIGTAHLLDAVRELEKPCSVLLITTDKVYHNNEWPYPYREVDRLGGYDPYSASKACAELVIDSYRNSFFNIREISRHKKGIAVARAGNVIGGGDWSKDRLLPDIARSLGNGAAISVRNPNSVRPWQHVLEPLAGYLLLGSKLAADPGRYSQAYNFGPYSFDALPVHRMVSIAIKKWGSGTFLNSAPGNAPHEAGLLTLDINKATDELGWKPTMDASAAVGLTIDWYRQFFKDKTLINALTEQQIVKFMNHG